MEENPARCARKNISCRYSGNFPGHCCQVASSLLMVTVKMTNHPTTITVARGDGIGPEIMDATLRILKAHEGLAALSERNRREFDPLLEVLRKEVMG